MKKIFLPFLILSVLLSAKFVAINAQLPTLANGKKHLLLRH